MKKTLLAMALLAGVMPLGARAGVQGEVRIRMVGAQNVPAVVVVESGDTIVWENLDSMGHNVAPNPVLADAVGGNFPVVSPLLDEGETWTCTPRANPYKWRCDPDAGGIIRRITLEPGRYAYLCQPHAAWQHGIIVVV